jgi:hypothetical protein
MASVLTKVSKKTPRLLFRFVLTALILALTEGHWAVLQAVAWTRMLVVYSRDASLSTALEQTFDGKHPCAMCKLIESARQSANGQELQEPSVKRDSMFCETYASLRFDASGFRFPVDGPSTYPSRTDPPPVPPPRRSAGSLKIVFA